MSLIKIFVNNTEITGVDNELTANSDNLIKSKSVQKMQYIFNVNLYNDLPRTAYESKQAARLAVPKQYRRFGLIITYLLSDGWVIERNDYHNWGDIANDTIWERDHTNGNYSWITIS